MEDPDRRRWKLGGRHSVDGHHQISYARDLSEGEVDEFKRRFRWFHDLAEQEGLARVVESAGRWQRILSRAAADLERDQAISNQSQRSAELELRAFLRLGERALVDLEKCADGLAMTLVDADQDFRGRAERIRRSGPFAALLETEREGRLESPLLLTRPALDPLYVRGLEVYGAEELITEAAERLRATTVALLLTAEAQFLVWAGELKEPIGAVSKGMPSLISFVEGPDGAAPGACEFTDFPVFAIDLLRAVLVNFHRGAQRQGIDLLLRLRHRRSVRFGEGEAGGAVAGGGSSDPLDAFATADFRIDADLLGSEPIDYWAPVVDRIDEREDGREMFSGNVRVAAPRGRIISVECEAGAAMLEQLRGGTVAANFEQGELLQALRARTDWEGALKLSETPPTREPERFEIWVPIFGLDVTEEVVLGGMAIVPAERARERIAPLAETAREHAGGRMLDEFQGATSHALAHATAAMPGDAEEAGLASVDVALAWLTTRGRYGAVLLPDGRPLEFHREEALDPPRRGGVVFIVGEDTARQWLRRPQGLAEALPRALSPSSRLLEPPLPPALPAGLRLALASLSLATTANEPLLQVQALSLSLEAYVAGRPNEHKLFTKADLKKVRALLDGQFPPAQQKRLDDLVAKLNEESHGLRLRRLVREDAVPVTDSELQLLSDLRQARNDIVHGTEVKRPPTREQIDYGIAVVSRMLVHRVAALPDGGMSQDPM
jgi:hypothetical protein